MTQMVVHPKHLSPTKWLRSWFERSMYIVALIAPVLTIPQVVLIWWGHQTSGVSMTTWGGYAVAAGLWLIYGMLHGQRQLIVSQASLFILNFAVVLGLVLHQ